MAATPFVASANADIRTGGVITGTIIAVVALTSFFASRKRWGAYISLINLVAGFWLVAAGALLVDPILHWQSTMFGVLAVVTAVTVIGLHQLHVDLTYAD